MNSSTDTSETADRLARERTVIETFYSAFDHHAPDVLDTICAPDWVDIPSLPGQMHGPEGLKPIIRDLLTALPDLRLTIHELIQQPGRIAVRAEITGTHRGPLLGLAATGQRIHLPIHEFHTLSEGRVTATWHMEDWFGLFQRLGRFPAFA